MKALFNKVGYAAIDTRAAALKSAPLHQDLSAMRIISLSGILTDPQRHWSLAHTDRLPNDCTVNDIVDSSGEWSALAANRDGAFSSYLAFGDYAGYAPIFYAIIPGKAIVISDSFSGVVQGFTNLGGTTSLNMGNYLTLITGRARTFETLVASQTMANEVSILRPDEALFVNNENAIIIDRAQLTKAKTDNNYNSVLRAAVGHTSNNIANVVSQNPGAVPLITLTGGVDSRLVLAFLKTTGFLDRFKIWTMDPRDKDSPSKRRIYTTDVEISNQIRKSYKLEWMSAWKRQKFSVSFAESLARHQSYNSNYSFQYHPSRYILLEEDSMLTLRGGGGEILRGTSGARIGQTKYNQYLQDGGSLNSISWAASEFLSRSVLTNKLKNVAHDFLVNTLRNQSGTSLRENMDSYYREHRNRAHFGHHRLSEGRNDYILQVLSNPHLQRLVDLVDYDYIHSNGIILDLFKATEPKLRKFPFESDAAHKELYAPSHKRFRYRKRDSWITDFDTIKDNTAKYSYRFSREPGIRGEDTMNDMQKFGVSLLEKGFGIVEELAPQEIRSALSIQHQRILSRVKNEQLPLGRLISIVASATDIVTPMALNSARHFFTSHRTNSKIPPQNILHSASAPYAKLLSE